MTGSAPRAHGIDVGELSERLPRKKLASIVRRALTAGQEGRPFTGEEIRPIAEKDSTPARIGPYPVERRLAVGGMAEVFLVRNVDAGPQLVALKRVRAEHSEKSRFVRMFLDEIRIASRLSHPAIPRVHSFSLDEAAPFYTMDFVKGARLGRVCRAARQTNRPMPYGCAVSIIADAADALHYAHEMTDEDGKPLGIVHRDVSPSNVLITTRGEVNVIDFGVAKATCREFETTRRVLKGRIGYMSPEQCLAGPVDRRSDVFALGLLLYELTTGRRAYQGSDYEILSRTADGEIVPPSTVVDDYPLALEEIVLRALRWARRERFATAGELADALRELCRIRRWPASVRSRLAYFATLTRAAARARAAARQSPRARRPSDQVTVVQGRDPR